MELTKGVEIKLEAGKIVLSADLKELVLNKLAEDIESGKIDIVKGTDLDKDVLLKAIAALKDLSI